MTLPKDELREKFRQIYEREPRIFRAPGSVNLIGEHTDYNEGFVLPFAIDRETFVADAVRDDLKITIYALDVGESFSLSAALEISVGFALLSLNEIKINRKELAFAAQKVEHEFAGVLSGIMDGFVSVFGKKNHALLLDCRSLEIEQIPLKLKDSIIAVCDSRVKHELSAGEYNTRRRECEIGVEILREKLPEIKSLRDVR